MGLLSDRKYGRLVVGNILITAFFGGAFVFVLVFSWPPLAASSDTLFTKIGTMTSIGGAFLGTYIAVWLINQNRTRRIEENYFYKVSVLASIQGILDAVLLLNLRLKDETENREKDASSLEMVRNLCTKDFEHHKDQIKVINTNTSVPADIRAAVMMLVEQGIKSMIVPSGYSIPPNKSARSQQ